MMKDGKCGGHCIAWSLVLVGALNWGLVGFFQWNLVESLLGSWPLAVRVVYALVGLSALLLLTNKKCGKCKK